MENREITPKELSPPFNNIMLPDVRFSCLNRDQMFTSRKRLYEISKVEITRVVCISIFVCALLLKTRKYPS